MLIYKASYFIEDVKEGSLLYPTIYTVYLSTKFSRISLNFKKHALLLDRLTHLNISIYNHIEIKKNCTMSIHGIVYAINDSCEFEDTIVLLVGHNGMSTSITFPVYFKSKFELSSVICILVTV